MTIKLYPVTKRFVSFYYWYLAEIENEIIRVEPDKAEYISVYGVCSEGLSHCIADVETQKEAIDLINFTISIIMCYENKI